MVGEPIQTWLLGGYAPDQATLTRFFSLHYLLPFVIAGVIILHIWALHIPGSGNPTGVDVKGPQDTVPFHPYYTAKDGFGAGVAMILLAILVFFLPNYLGHADNYIPANPLSTPAHIVPEWYFWPFYAILRAFTVDFILPAKLWGVLAMFALDPAALLPALARQVAGPLGQLPADLPDLLLDPGRRRAGARLSAAALPAEEPYVMISQVATMYYFAHFLIILPLLSMVEKTRPLPNSISESVLHGEEAEAAPAGIGAGPAATATA